MNPDQTLDIIEAMENYLAFKRPPVEIRPKLDLGYKIETQSIIIFEIRPKWDNPSSFNEFPVAKTTFVKSQKVWNVFWRRASGAWEGYKPCPTVKSLDDFLNLVEEDKHHCFWG